ncbi:unnamed protein product [Pleuronectes platessa]|uniref:Uncharacterized protein n=1 Tax=Pleuronectes platessa TaxID=8262 RepID=A0A9N7YK83_PLEPL|nr:unnamed protein product [Pleuronectes platessa]
MVSSSSSAPHSAMMNLTAACKLLHFNKFRSTCSPVTLAIGDVLLEDDGLQPADAVGPGDAQRMKWINPSARHRASAEMKNSTVHLFSISPLLGFSCARLLNDQFDDVVEMWESFTTSTNQRSPKPPQRHLTHHSFISFNQALGET